jgi:hypothetical protein
MRQKIIIDPNVPLEPIVSAVLLQALADARASNPQKASEARMFLEHDSSLWIEVAGIPYAKCNVWDIKRVLRARRTRLLLEEFENR